MRAKAVSLASVINSYVLQPLADETKLKMMQEVSENFEVSLNNVMKQIYLPSGLLFRMLK